MFSGLLTGVISGFLLSTQLDLSNMEAFQRGLRQGFKESMMVGLGSTVGDAIYWVIMLMGHHKIVENMQTNKFYIFVYAMFLLLLGFISIADLRRFNNQGTSYNNKILVFMNRPFIAGFVMSTLTPSTLLWSFVVTEIFEASFITKELSLASEPQIFVGLMIGGVLWAIFLGYISSKSKVFIKEKIMKSFIFINSLLFFVSSIVVLAKVFM